VLCLLSGALFGAPAFAQSIVSGNRVYFVRQQPATGAELWRTDGGAAGTQLVKDIRPGDESSGIRDLVDVQGTLFFRADDGVSGLELWKSDGTAAGTVLVKDLRPGSRSSVILSPVAFGGRLFFVTDDGVSGLELWKSDGTAAGTELVKDIAPGPASSSPSSLTVWNGSLLFGAAGKVWKSDGTDAGTTVVYDAGQMVRQVWPAGSRFFFAVASGAQYPFYDPALYVSDGTPAGTTLLARFLDMTVFASSGQIEVGGNATVAAGILYFWANDGATGIELWKSDGTPSGTTLVKDMNPGPASSQPVTAPYAVGGTLYVGVIDGTTQAGRNVARLWKTDGTTPGTVVVRAPSVGGPVDAVPLADRSGTLFFRAFSNGVATLWSSDGTSGGTQVVRDPSTGGPANVTALSLLGGTLYFQGETSDRSTSLWKSDGTSAGTVVVKPFWFGLQAPFLFNGAVLLIGDAGGGPDLWRTDGTAAGTIRIDDAATTVSVADGSVVEGHSGLSLMDFTVTLTAPAPTAVSVRYVTYPGTATSGIDYMARGGEVVFLPGQTSRSILISVVGDTVSEGDESFFVILTGAEGARLAATQAQGTIRDDEPAVAPQALTQYRLYSVGSAEHLFTTDLHEYQVLGDGGWLKEGAAYTMLDRPGTLNGAETVPCYRLYNTADGHHHWTTDLNEAVVLASGASTFQYEGITGYMLRTQAPGSKPLYRLVLPAAGIHLWTADAHEHAVLQTQGWVSEGVLAYVLD
jgi:ELWxxDGT repeat protein